MDIDGGMDGDLYDSMAVGVANAAVVVAFIDSRYQVSENVSQKNAPTVSVCRWFQLFLAPASVSGFGTADERHMALAVPAGAEVLQAVPGPDNPLHHGSAALEGVRLAWDLHSRPSLDPASR